MMVSNADYCCFFGKGNIFLWYLNCIFLLWSRLYLVYYFTPYLGNYFRVWSAYFCPLSWASHWVFHDKGGAVWSSGLEECHLWHNTIEKRPIVAREGLFRIWTCSFHITSPTQQHIANGSDRGNSVGYWDRPRRASSVFYLKGRYEKISTYWCS